jgi:3-oxoacyl-[acyl-carrier protein] reductase
LLLSNSLRAGVVGLAKTLSKELGPDNILVNNVCPGFTMTDRVEQLANATAERTGVSRDDVVRNWESTIPLGRIGSTAEFAALVAFLASERASYITGTTIPIDGGAVQGLM